MRNVNTNLLFVSDPRVIHFIEKAGVKLHASHNSSFGVGKYLNSSCGLFNPGTEIYVEF
jgi:hypothetical protein